MDPNTKELNQVAAFTHVILHKMNHKFNVSHPTLMLTLCSLSQQNSFVFFDIAIGKKKGRVIFELFDDVSVRFRRRPKFAPTLSTGLRNDCR